MVRGEEERPKIRDVDFFPVKNNEGTFIAVRDPHDFSPQVLAFRPGLLPIISLMDGKHTLREIVKTVEHDIHAKVTIDQLRQVVEKLDEALFLVNDRFEKHRKQVIENYKTLEVRPAAHSGVSYPEDAEQIHAYFADHFLGGPGFPSLDAKYQTPRLLISPHIDPRVGGTAFAWAYKALAESDPADVYLILGTAHFPTRHPFVATRKDFQTPLGRAHTDRDFLARLEKDLPFDLYADEFAHRNEHSIEFQVVYLQHTLPVESQSIRIVPILCGSFAKFVRKNKEPGADPAVSAFIRALKRELAAEKRRVCVIAGVDLAHVGGRFGDSDLSLTPSRRSVYEETDLTMLDIVLNGDASGFFKFIAEEGDARRICGFPAIYTLLKALDVKDGQLLHYNQSFEKSTNSLVTFCSIKFD